METIALTEVRDEAQRAFDICNACRYCEGFCAVFQEMTEHRTFDISQIDHLANLCHNCTACYHACQYKPPHEFNLNVPKTLAELRPLTWQDHAWPRSFAKLLETNGLKVSLAMSLVFSIFLIGAFTFIDQTNLTSVHTGPGAFYAVIGHGMIVLLAGSASLWAILATFISARTFNRSLGVRRSVSWSDVFSDLVTLKHLGGGHGEGCNEEDDAFSNRRRLFHHLTMWGFLLCFAATCVATVYELALGWMSPFPFFSLPVMLGSIGGIGLILGPIGFLLTHNKFHPETKNRGGMDVAFIVLLLLISVTGFLLLGLRDTSAMGSLLAIHLSFVITFFVTLPYTKFVHAIYRTISLVHFHRKD